GTRSSWQTPTGTDLRGRSLSADTRCALLHRRPFALEVAEARAVGLVVDELLHAFLMAAFLVVELERVALGVEIVLRLRLVHETHGADRFLGIAQRRLGFR